MNHKDIATMQVSELRRVRDELNSRSLDLQDMANLYYIDLILGRESTP